MPRFANRSSNPRLKSSTATRHRGPPCPRGLAATKWPPWLQRPPLRGPGGQGALPPPARLRAERAVPGRAPEAGPSAAARPSAALRPGVAAGRAPGSVGGRRLRRRPEGPLRHRKLLGFTGIPQQSWEWITESQVTFDTTRHFSEGAIRKRSLERLKLQEQEHVRKRGKKREGVERKRRGDEKVQERKKKAKLERREERQIDGDEKHPQKQQKVPAEEQQWPENMPEWEERKSLLAQRRVESIRLLTVLLNRVKDFAQLASQKVDPSLGVRKDNSFSETALKGIHQELINSHYRAHKEVKHKEEFKCPLTQKGSGLCSEEGDVSNFHASTCHIVRTILNDPSTALSSDGLPGREASNSLGCGSLLITVTQDCRVIKSLDGRGYPTSNVVHTQTASDEDGCKKQKVYETDEFIHYLLNYYQTPRYARVCLEPKTTANKCWWKRVVSDDDSDFDISFGNKRGQHFREVSPLQNLNKGNCSSDDNYRLVITVGELESTDRVLENKTCGDRFAKKLQVQRNDSLTVDTLPHAGLNHSLDCTAVTRDKEFKQEDGSSEETDSCMQLESLRKIQRKCKKMFHNKVKFKTLHTTMAGPDVTPHDGSPLQETLQRTGDERKLMLRREMDADVRGCPLFPLELIQTNPCSDTFCGAEPRRGC
ncbi:LOW QUALITY PROTEIN: A-kinase anchor protein 17B-like [Theristicus caerulescens]